MAEPPKPLNIDDSYKTDEKSSPPSIPSKLTISESTLQVSTSDLQHLECRQQIIPKHLIGSDYERQLSKSDIKAESPEPLNIDDSSKFEEESSLPNLIFTISKTLKSSNLEFTERMLHSIEEMRRQPCKFDITPPEPLNIDDIFKSEEGSSLQRTMSTSFETSQASTSEPRHLESSQENVVELDHERHSYKSDITPEPPESLNIDDSSKSEEGSLFRCTKPISLETPQASTSDPRHLESSQEDVVELDHERVSSQSVIIAEPPEPLNIEDFSKSEEESLPSSKSRQLVFLQHTYYTSSSPAIMPSDDQIETHSRDSQSRQKKAFCKFTIECISFIIFLILSLILYLYFRLHIYQNDKRNNTIIFPIAAIEMEKGILGQNQIVQVLTEYLQQDSPLLKVVALIGDTSVKKSYTVDLIKKKFRRRKGFSSLYPNFVVLENLRAEHSTDVINYMKTFQESYGNQQITILAVFKVEQIDDSTMHSTDLNRIINTVKDTFIEANISIKIIRYEPLTENALEKHIIYTAKDIRLTFSQDEIDIIKRGLTEDNIDSRKTYNL